MRSALPAIFLVLMSAACASTRKAVVKPTAEKIEAPAASTTTASVPVEVAGSTAPINVLYPTEDYVHPATRGARIMGWVSRPKSKLRVNGQELKVYPDGAFLGYLPITPGSFTFHCELDLPSGTTTYDRTILVAQPLRADSTAQTVIDPEAMQPSDDLELRPDGWLFVQMKGTPGGQAQFQIQGAKKRLPMVESGGSLGIYKGAYQIQPDELFEGAPINFYLTGPNKSSARAASKGKLTVRDDIPSVVVVRPGTEVNVRSEHGEAFILFPPGGTKFVTAGREGGETNVRLSSTLGASLPTASLRFLALGTPPPKAVLGTIKTEVGVDSTTVSLSLSDTVPFMVEPGDSPDVLRLRLFYTVDHTNWIIYDPNDSFVREIRWSQPDAETALVSIYLSPKARLWGTETRWEGGVLKLGLRHPPKLAQTGSALKGRLIVVDAGHMPSAPGAFGPRGVLEKDVNLAIAKYLEKYLADAGAKPLMTREGDDEVSLSDRPRIAREHRGELFVSVHNNAMADGDDPFERPNGYSIFYYHPYSLELGASIHRAYQRLINLPDEGLRFGDLLIPRIADMPSILTESAYIIHPEQEILLTTPAFQKRLARAIFEGIRDFFEAERQRQWQGRSIPSSRPAGKSSARRGR